MTIFIKKCFLNSSFSTIFDKTFFHPAWSKNFLLGRVILTLNFECARERKGGREREDLKWINVVE